MSNCVFVCVCVCFDGLLAHAQQPNGFASHLSVFDDGDEKTLRRSSLCLKGARHFAESEASSALVCGFITASSLCFSREQSSADQSANTMAEKYTLFAEFVKSVCHGACFRSVRLMVFVAVSRLCRRSTGSLSPTPSTSAPLSSERKATAVDDQTPCELRSSLT